MTPEELLEAMGAQLREADAAWARIDPVPVFDAFAEVAGPVERESAPAVGGEGAERRVAAALAVAYERDAELNLFTSIHEEAALADAARASGPLAGMPVAVKDLLDVRGIVTLAGSRILEDEPPAQRDATVVARLRAAGAAIVGSANMDELAYGFTTENTHYGPTRNPLDPERVAGGSSGARRQRSPPGPSTRRSAATRTGRSGSRRRSAASTACGRRSGSCRAPARCCSRPASTCSARSRGRRLTWRPCSRRSPARTGTTRRVDPCRRRPRWTPRRCAWRAPGGELWDGASAAILAAAERVAQALGATDVLELPDVGARGRRPSS